MTVVNPPNGRPDQAEVVILAGRCAQPGCTVAQDGRCVQGLRDPVDCPRFEADEVEPDDTLVDEQSETSSMSEPPPPARGRQRLHLSDEILAVHSGEALSAQEATAVLRAYDTEVVVILGDIGVGKTTLLAALYELLARGPVGDWSFAGSRSLLGFEARSFLATAASGRAVADTPRTSRDTDRIALHLSVRRKDGVTRHLLLGDVSGEHAGNLMRFNEPGDYGPLLRSGTRLLVLLDGARLRTATGQNLVMAEARTLLRAVAEGGDLRPGTPIDLVVTKWDRCGDAVGLGGELQRLLDATRDWWDPVELHHTAARPQGQGLPELFEVLLRPRTRQPSLAVTHPESTRAIHRYTPTDGLARRFIAATHRSVP